MINFESVENTGFYYGWFKLDNAYIIFRLHEKNADDMISHEKYKILPMEKIYCTVEKL